MAVEPIPQGYRAITPYLIVKGAAAAIDFYKHVFDATELMRMAGPDGRVGHAELRIGDSVLMLADEPAGQAYRSPSSLGGSSVTLLLYVRDVDAAFARAMAAGAQTLKPLANQFYGDRSGTLQDPYGHVWTVATHVEDVSPEEMQRRGEDAMRSPPGAKP
jgi:PhnB protein